MNFNNEYKCFDFKIKMYFTMLFWSTIISTVFLLIFSSRLEIIKFNIYSLLFSFILNVVLCVVIFINPFRKVSLHILMWSNGFSVKLDETIFYSSTLKNRFTCKKCDEYFRNIYCIVCLFKYVLNINEQASIDFINDLVEDSKLDDYLLYALCMYFYYDKYKFKKSNKYLSENFKKICDGQNINYKIACNNVLEVLKDIDGDYKKDLFSCYVGNVKYIKVHTKKKY